MNIYKATLEFLPAMLTFVREEMFKMGCSKEKSTLFEIAVEEALVNIIKHGYPDIPGTIELEINKKDDVCISLTLKDKGIPFNPADFKSEFNPAISLEDRSLGGSGLQLMQKIADKMLYSREDDSNVLTLEKLIK